MFFTSFLSSHFYDGDGLRVSRTDNLAIPPKTTYYVWDTENPTGYPQVLEEIENNQVVRRYGYGLFLETIDIKNGTNFERFYVVRDGTNSVRMLLDSTGNVSATYDYDAFGNVLSTTNNNPLTIGNPYQFHSEYKDPATNLVYLRARWYEPESGRFVGMDKWEGNFENPSSLNKYVFVRNDAVNLNDPSGNIDCGSAIASMPAFNEFSSVTAGSFNISIDMPFLFMPPEKKGQRQLMGLMFAESGGPTTGEGGEITSEKVAIGATVLNRIYYIQQGLNSGIQRNRIDFGQPDVWSIINHNNQFGSIGNQHWKLVFNNDDLKPYEELKKSLKKRQYREKFNQCNTAMLQLIFSGGPPYRVAELNNQIPIGFHDSAKSGLFLRAEWFQSLGANEFWKYKSGREYK